MDTKEFKGKLDASGKKFAIVISRFNEFLSKELLAGALDCLERHNASKADIFWTPGSFEIPGVAMQVAESKNYDAIIALGVIIHGDTPHAEYIASVVTKGLSKINYKTKIPTVFGIITADTIEQAIERSGTKAGNKGYHAAQSAIEMVNLITHLSVK